MFYWPFLALRLSGAMDFPAKGALNGIIAKNLCSNRSFSIIVPLYMKVTKNRHRYPA